MLSSAHSGCGCRFASVLSGARDKRASAPLVSPPRRVARARSNKRSGSEPRSAESSAMVLCAAAGLVLSARRAAPRRWAVSSTRASSRLTPPMSSRHKRLSSLRLSMSGVRIAPSFCTMASSWSGSKLPSIQPIWTRSRPAAALPVAISASPSRILPMELTGSRPANQATAAAGLVAGSNAASARTSRAVRRGHSGLALRKASISVNGAPLFLSRR